MIRRGQNDLGIESEQVSFDVELLWEILIIWKCKIFIFKTLTIFDLNIWK